VFYLVNHAAQQDCSEIYKPCFLIFEMAGVVVVIVRLMPDSVDEDLEKIKKESERSLTKEGGMNISFEEKPIAFGLKAVFAKFAFPEDKGTNLIEDILGKIKGVSSVDIEDYRRAFG